MWEEKFEFTTSLIILKKKLTQLIRKVTQFW